MLSSVATEIVAANFKQILLNPYNNLGKTDIFTIHEWNTSLHSFGSSLISSIGIV